MSEKETLPQVLRRWAMEDADTCEPCEKLTGKEFKNCKGDCTSWLREIADIIEREYLPMPRYEDGETVMIGSVCEWGFVESVEITASIDGWGNWLVRCGEDGVPHEGTLSQRVERGVLVEGKPVLKGDKLWSSDPETEYFAKVSGIDNGKLRILWEDGVADIADPSELTWYRPDTIERIREDALKSAPVYWGCDGTPCNRCPAKVDGKKPADRYGVGSCLVAVKLDLISRTEEVCGR